MKLSIYNSEAFPIYSVHSSRFAKDIEVEIDIAKRWKASFEQFKITQQEIIDELKNQGFEDRLWPYPVYDGFMVTIKEEKPVEENAPSTPLQALDQGLNTEIKTSLPSVDLTKIAT